LIVFAKDLDQLCDNQYYLAFGRPHFEINLSSGLETYQVEKHWFNDKQDWLRPVSRTAHGGQVCLKLNLSKWIGTGVHSHKELFRRICKCA
jgi:hypothetical protein